MISALYNDLGNRLCRGESYGHFELSSAKKIDEVIVRDSFI